MPTLKGTEVSLSYPFLVSCIFFNKCLYFSYYVAGYLLDRPCIYIMVHYSAIEKRNSVICDTMNGT